MRNKTILIFFLCSWFAQGYSQKIDTLYWHDAVNKHHINGVKRIVLTINDSTYKTTKYWKGKITAINYTGILNGCLTPIKKDTLFENGNEVRSVIKNEVLWLGKSSNCDSLLLVQHIKTFRKGQFVEEATLKRLGEFADCPCGTWKYYKDNEEIHAEEFGSCYDSKLDNLILMKTVWSPDKEYKLELYKEQLLFAMPGQGSDHMATIILKDKDDKTLQYVSSNSIESIMYRDIEVEWEMNKGRVWYGKARLIDFKKKPTHNKN